MARNGKYFRAVATPNREKPKEEEEEQLAKANLNRLLLKSCCISFYDLIADFW